MEDTDEPDEIMQEGACGVAVVQSVLIRRRRSPGGIKTEEKKVRLHSHN